MAAASTGAIPRVAHYNYRPTYRNHWAAPGRINKLGDSYNSRTGKISAGNRAPINQIPMARPASYNRPAQGSVTRPGGASSRDIVRPGTTPGGNTRPAPGTPPQDSVTQPGGGTSRDIARPGTTRPAPDNVFAGKDGNVYRPAPSGGGWQQNNRGSWQNAPADRTRDLNRDLRSREMGQQRTETLRNPLPAPKR